MTTILPIELATPMSVPRAEVTTASWLLRAGVTFPDRFVLAFGAPGMKKADSLRIFETISPAENGYTIELGAVLAERLPLESGQSEAALAVARTRAEAATFCISNAMARLHYRKGDADRHALCPVYAVSQFAGDHPSEFPSPPHVEHIPSVVTARYVVRGENAEDALSESLESSMDDFIAGINQIVSAMVVSIDPSKMNVLVPVYDRGSFTWIYLLIRGEGETLERHLVSSSLLRTALVPQGLNAERWDSFRSILNGTEPIDVALEAVRTAQSHLQAGAYDFALLLAAIAAEVATTRYVHARLLDSGVPKKKLENVERDLTFSIMLNTQLMALSPREAKPDAALLVTIDSLRKARNEMMHDGRCQTSRLDIIAMVNAADKFLEYIRRLEAGQARS